MKKEEQIEENLPEETKDEPTAPLRQIIIETNGNDIKLVRAEVSGKIELIAILQNVITYLNK